MSCIVGCHILVYDNVWVYGDVWVMMFDDVRCWGTNPNHSVHHYRILNSIKTIQKKIKIVAARDQTHGNTHHSTTTTFEKCNIC